MSTGYIKLFRSLKQSSFYRDSEYVHLWVHLLMSVNRTEKRLKLEKSNQFIDLHPGQVLTSRDKLSEQTGIHRSKVDRILKSFKSEQQIEQQTFSKYRIISITNWWEYQVGEQQSEPQVSTKRASSEPQVSTNKKEEKEKEGKEKQLPTVSQVSDLYRKYAGVNQVNGGQVVVFQDFIKIFSLEAIEQSFQAAAASSIPVKSFLNWCKTRMERTRDAPAPAVADDDGEKQVAYLKSLGCI